MSDTQLANLTTTTMKTTVKDFSVSPKHTEGVSGTGETFYTNDKFTERYGYYSSIPELKRAIDTLANYAVGKGYTTATARNKVVLDSIRGCGEDTLQSLAWNHIVTKKFHGDAYMQIIRDPVSNFLVNLKPLDPSSVTTVFDRSGIIKEYQIRSKVDKDAIKTLKPWQVFHSMNERIADNIHGTSVIDACKWVIDARNEAMADWRRISHRSTIRVMYIDMEDQTKLSTVRTQYMEAIKNGELLIVPAKKTDAEFEQLTLPPIEGFLQWIQYLEENFFVIVGTPRVMTGATGGLTEASAKVGMTTFDQGYLLEEKQFEDDFKAQVGIEMKWNRPASILSEMGEEDARNTSQTGFQPNDVRAGSGKF